MQKHKRRVSFAILSLLYCASIIKAQSKAFTYQGRLSDAGNPANGTYDIQFRLFDAANGGQIGATIIILILNRVTVAYGVLTYQLIMAHGHFRE